MQVIGIFGLGHSGSTLLDRCLSSHEQCVGLGEVDRTIENASRFGAPVARDCSCGVSASECPVWSILNSAEGNSGDSECLGTVFRHTRDALGRSTVIDSSKRLGQARVLARMASEGQWEFTPVFLVRDYRSWSISRKVSRDDRGLGIVDYIKRAWQWMVRNEKRRRDLGKLGLKVVPVWYEDFVQAPSAVAAPVYRRAGLEPTAVDPGQACQHALHGNGMRKDPARNSAIVINDRWKRDWRNRFLLPLVFGPAFYNLWLRRRVRQGRV